MENVHDMVEPYLLGELGEEEKKRFDRALEDDPALKRSVEEHRHIMAQLDAARLRGKVKAEMDKTKGRPKRAWALALGAALLAALAYLAAPNTHPEKPSGAAPQQPAPAQPIESAPEPMLEEEAPAKPQAANRILASALRYQHQPTANMVRGTGAASQLRAAFEAYEQQSYSLALQRLRSVPDLANNEAARYLRGSARFRQGDLELAAQDFKSLSESFQFKHEARWNYALCLWASGKNRQAKQAVRAMAADPDSPFREKAQDLLAKMANN